MRSGYVELLKSTGTLRVTGQWGHYWSSQAGTYTSSTAATAYNFEFNTAINPSHENSRWYGFPLRCLSTVLVYVEWMG